MELRGSAISALNRHPVALLEIWTWRERHENQAVRRIGYRRPRRGRGKVRLSQVSPRAGRPGGVRTEGHKAGSAVQPALGRSRPASGSRQPWPGMVELRRLMAAEGASNLQI